MGLQFALLFFFFFVFFLLFLWCQSGSDGGEEQKAMAISAGAGEIRSRTMRFSH